MATRGDLFFPSNSGAFGRDFLVLWSSSGNIFHCSGHNHFCPTVSVVIGSSDLQG